MDHSSPHVTEALIVPLPWTTPPTGQGHAMCGWCDRAIYLPAAPCSVRPVAGLLAMDTGPGLGDRCKWEMSTRADVDAATGHDVPSLGDSERR